MGKLQCSEKGMDSQNTPYIQGTVCYEQMSLNHQKKKKKEETNSSIAGRVMCKNLRLLRLSLAA